MKTRWRSVLTTSIEVLGGLLVVAGVTLFSIPVGIIVAGVLMIVLGGLLA